MSPAPYSPFPEHLRRLLTTAWQQWRTGQTAAVRVVPASHPGAAGFPCVEDPALVITDRTACTVSWPGGSYRIRAGEALIIPPDRPYHLDYHAQDDDAATLNIFARGEDVVLFARHQAVERWPKALWRFAAGTGAIIDQALRLAILLQEQTSTAGAWAGDGIRTQVALVLGAAQAACTAPLRPSQGGPVVVVRCRQALREHLADPHLTVATLARMLDYDASWLGRRFRQATGRTLREELILMRIDRARDLLLRRDLSIAAIAALCGFSSNAHFSRCFRRIEGNPPSRYRRYGHLESEAGA